MSRRGRLPKELWETYRAMSTDVGKIGTFKFLAFTACMNKEERQVMALLEVSARLFSDDEKFGEFIEEFAKPFFEFMGRASWDRDIVTDLGLALSLKQTSKKSVSKLLQFNPSKAKKD